MSGFRFSQQQLLTDALIQDSNGLIGAPTRYGKTTLMVNTLKAYPNLTAVVVAPGVDLVKQLYADLLGPRGLPPGREVRLICGSKGKKQAGPGGVTVCSVDSLGKIDTGVVDLVLADEPHALVTDSRLRLIDAFTKARRLGFGATLKGRFDGRDQLIEGVFGHVLVERTYKEAVEEGAICPLHILFLKVEIEPRQFRDRNSAYNSILFHSHSAANLAKEICDIIPAEFQTMVFVKDEKQAEMLQETIGRDSTIAMAKRMTNKEREECDRLMKENIIKRCLCTKIYVQGVTFSDVRVLVNLEGGGNNTSAIQKPGRLAEIRPNKKCGIVIDLLFVPPDNDWNSYPGEEWLALCRDSKARKTAYEEKGYGIHIVENTTQLKEKFYELI
jgi:superfamily II DNA or RNA helicase